MMNNKKLKIVLYMIMSIIIFAGFVLSMHYINIHNYQTQQELIRKHNYQRHRHMWNTVKIAKKYPTPSNLAQITFHRPWKKSIIFLNHNKSTLNPKSWKYNHIDFSMQDQLGRVSAPATAFLEQQNTTGDALRVHQKVLPVGWHQLKFQGQYILNRGHLIAYSLSKDISFNGLVNDHNVAGNQDDPNNLFTETSFCNQQLQYSFETLIRIALEHNKKIIYQVQPIFRGTELMPRGVHLQAIATDKKFQFNVYCFNVQPGIYFNYQTGYPHIDRHYHVSSPKSLIKHSEKLDDHDKYMKWQRKIMDLYQKHSITYKQAKYYESKLVGKYLINGIPNIQNGYHE